MPAADYPAGLRTDDRVSSIDNGDGVIIHQFEFANLYGAKVWGAQADVYWTVALTRDGTIIRRLTGLPRMPHVDIVANVNTILEQIDSADEGAWEAPGDPGGPVTWPVVQQFVEDEVTAAVEAQTPGTELGYAERITTFSTNDAATLATRIDGLTMPVVGNGRPVLIEFFAPNVYHDVANAVVTVYLVVDDVALSADGQVGGNSSPRLDGGPSAYMQRRLVIPDGVTKTFKVGVLVGAGGYGHLVANASARMHLTARAA